MMKRFNLSKDTQELEDNNNHLEQFTKCLEDARNSVGLDVRMMAERLYTISTNIQHLEEGNFDELSHLTKAHLKGYLKRYCEITHSDSEHVLELFEKIYKESEVKIKINKQLFDGSVVYLSGKRFRFFQFKKKRWIVIALALVVFIIIFSRNSNNNDLQNSEYETLIIPHS